MLHPNSKIGSVHLTVKNLDKQLAYYQEVIGLSVIEKREDRIDLGTGSTPLLSLYPNEGAMVPGSPQVGLYHFALLLPTRRDLALTLRHLVEIQEPIGASDHGVSEALYLNDPEGNGIEIYADRPRDEWQFDPSTGKLAMTTQRINGPSLMQEIENSDRWLGLPDGTVMGHVHLRVPDIERGKAFYVDQIGFEHMQDYGGSASFVSAGGYHHHLGFNSWETSNLPSPLPGVTGLKYFELLVPEMTEERLLAQLEIAEGQPISKINGGWLVRDPFGNGVLIRPLN